MRNVTKVRLDKQCGFDTLARRPRIPMDDRCLSNTAPLYQYDYGQILKFDGVELPMAYEVHFSNFGQKGAAKSVIGTPEGVLIPDEYLLTGEPIYVWIFLHEGESDGETEYSAMIPVNKRPKAEETEPTPVQQDVITQTIAALNTGVERAEKAQTEWENMTAQAETLHPESDATASYADGVLTLGIPQGVQGEKGEQGEKGDKGETGSQGIQGIQGERGEKGEKGDKGDTGDKGDKGDSYVLTQADKAEIAGMVDAPSEIDDTAGSGDTDKTWSANKISEELANAGSVQDVTVDGTSIVSNGVANIPIAGIDTAGVVKVGGLGVKISNNELVISPASSGQIKRGTGDNSPIVSSKEHESAFYGLAKASGDTTQSQSSNPVGTYTDSAKAKICEMLGIPYERLLYRNDTFGNVWTEYQPTGVDFENNAIILSDDTGLPTEISPVRCAHLIAKPLLTLQYGTIPTELYEANRIKAIGDNKIQFYNNSGGLVTFTDTSYIDMTKFKLLYRPSPNSDASIPIFSDFDASHKIHVRMTVPAMLESACGIKALDVDGNTIRGSSYGVDTTQKSNSVIYTKGDAGVAGINDYDGYAILIGNRSFSTLQASKNTYAQYDVWFWPNPAFGGCEYETKIIYFATTSSNKKNRINPCTSFSRGFTSVPIAQVTYSANNPKDFPAPNSIFEVWDCGTVY